MSINGPKTDCQIKHICVDPRGSSASPGGISGSNLVLFGVPGLIFCVLFVVDRTISVAPLRASKLHSVFEKTKNIFAK